MPVASTMPELLDAIRTSRTKTTEALDWLFKNPLRWKSDPNPNVKNAIAWLGSTAAFGPLPSAVRKILKGESLGSPPSPYLPLPLSLRLTNEELKHINQWPPIQKNKVRKKLNKAVGLDCDVHFFWKFATGTKEKTDPIVDPVAGGDINVTFRSPEINVKSGPVTVEVAP